MIFKYELRFVAFTSERHKSQFIFEYHFYRATLCVSAIFALDRPVSVRLSVSITLVHSIHTAEAIVKLLCRPGSPIILLFDAQRRYPIPRGPLQRGRKIGLHGGEKILRFSTEIAVYLGNGTI